MPEPTTDQTSPADAGHTTTEYKLTRALIVGLGLVAGATVTFAGLHQAMPDVGWISTAATLVGSIGAAVMLAGRYIATRREVKVAIANLQAARVLAGIDPGNPTAPGLPTGAAVELAAAGRAALAATQLNPELAGKVYQGP